MKTLYRDTHDYITVTVVTPEKIRLNLTRSWGGGKVSSSAPAGTSCPNLVTMQTAFKDKTSSLHLFMKGPKQTSPLAWMQATKAASEQAADMSEFFVLLSHKLQDAESAKKAS